MNAFILAAGEGTRFRPYTLTIPKPSLPILGTPMISFCYAYLKDLASHGEPIEKLVLNTFHLPNIIKTTISRLPKISKEVFFSDEVGILLGSGGGLKNAQKFLQTSPRDTIIMLNGDEVFIPTHRNFLSEALSFHEKSQSIATLIVIDFAEVGVKLPGIWSNPEGSVFGFGKQSAIHFAHNKSALNQGSLQKLKCHHYIGMALFNSKIFSYLDPDKSANILYDGVIKALENGEDVQIFKTKGDWFETGNLSDYLETHDKLLQFLATGSFPSQKFFLEYVLNEIGKIQYQIENHKSGIIYCYSPNQNPRLRDKGFIESLEGFLVAPDSLAIEPGSSMGRVVFSQNAAIAPKISKNNLYL